MSPLEQDLSYRIRCLLDKYPHRESGNTRSEIRVGEVLAAIWYGTGCGVEYLSVWVDSPDGYRLALRQTGGRPDHLFQPKLAVKCIKILRKYSILEDLANV